MSSRNFFAIASLASLAALASACSSTGSSTSSATVSAIGLSPNPCAMGRTNSQQMTATATFTDSSKQNITTAPGAVWSSANTGTATVSAQGVVVGVNAGSTAITIAYEGATGTLDCTVGP